MTVQQPEVGDTPMLAPPPPELSRRTFLQLTATALALIGLDAACGPAPLPSLRVLGSPSASAAPLASGASFPDAPFDVWMEMRDAFPRSPDHLPALAAAAVATRDPAAIHAFVRDHIAVLPMRSVRNDDYGTATRWGQRATLRCGAGSPRDVVELLVELYRMAGFEADVVFGSPDLTALPSGWDRTAFLRVPDHVFAPVIDDAATARWQAALTGVGAAITTPEVPIDLGPAADAIVTSVKQALPPSVVAEPFLPGMAAVPVARVVVGGAPQYAFPFLPGAPFGPSYVNGATTAPPPDAGPSVTVTVSAATLAAPDRPTVLATASYRSEDVVGRPIAIGLVPPGNLDAIAPLALRDVVAVYPLIQPLGVDLTTDQLDSMTVIGSALSIRGETISNGPNGPRVDGRTIGGSAPAASGSSPQPSPAGRPADVRVVTVEAAADGFPVVSLRVSPLDQAGQAVAGLTANELDVREDGQPVSFILQANQFSGPRVVLIVDQSGSTTYATPDHWASLTASVARAILDHAAGATFQVVGLSGGAGDGGYVLTDPEAIGAAAGALPTDGSPMWSAIANSVPAGPDVIVAIGDFVEDPPAAATRGAVAAGPPVVAIGVSKVDAGAQEAVVRLTGGAAIDATSPAAMAAIGKGLATFVGSAMARPYRLSYEANEAGPSARNLTVTVVPDAGQSTASSQVPAGPHGTASYQVPLASARITPPGWVGLYLSIQIGTDDPLVRTLAGAPFGVRLDQSDPAASPASFLADVREAFVSSHLVVIEGSAPPLSVRLDEYLTSRLSWRAAWRPIAEANGPAIMAALDPPPTPLPDRLLALLSEPTARPSSRTAPERLTAILLSERRRGARGIERRMDILAETRYVTVTDDAAEALAGGIAAGARQAAAEGQLYKTSAASLLAGRQLQYLGPDADIVAFVDRLAAEQQAPWRVALDAEHASHRLVPKDGGTNVAFWTVDGRTGSLRGVLGTGAGGGTEECESDDQIEDVMMTIELFELAIAHYSRIPHVMALVGKVVVTAVFLACMQFYRGTRSFGPGFCGAIAGGATGLMVLAFAEGLLPHGSFAVTVATTAAGMAGERLAPCGGVAPTCG